ncbi:hypothetical protein D9619_004069 [Psilocybe cf. subviscida]|uniref:Uncharacterized protein n=1 Tax=Psilocybe cf. subviscida TaxID=2480587 RepID=A0A8H5BP21_9AGAR|nr:hypothetical protein D9619_004069 [Psilocybe cf. subviscida]
MSNAHVAFWIVQLQHRLTPTAEACSNVDSSFPHQQCFHQLGPVADGEPYDAPDLPSSSPALPAVTCFAPLVTSPYLDPHRLGFLHCSMRPDSSLEFPSAHAAHEGDSDEDRVDEVGLHLDMDCLHAYANLIVSTEMTQPGEKDLSEKDLRDIAQITTLETEVGKIRGLSNYRARHASACRSSIENNAVTIAEEHCEDREETTRTATVAGPGNHHGDARRLTITASQEVVGTGVPRSRNLLTRSLVEEDDTEGEDDADEDVIETITKRKRMLPVAHK